MSGMCGRYWSKYIPVALSDECLKSVIYEMGSNFEFCN